jgi:hypothetical protein
VIRASEHHSLRRPLQRVREALELTHGAKVVLLAEQQQLGSARLARAREQGALVAHEERPRPVERRRDQRERHDLGDVVG